MNKFEVVLLFNPELSTTNLKSDNSGLNSSTTI